MGAKRKSELRLPPGVRIASDSSFEIDFRYRGVRCRERKKLPINQRNANYCGNLKGRIEDEIAKNEFIYSKHFPHSKRARRIAALPGDSVLVKSHLEEWLTREKPHIQHSTLRGYQKVLKYHLVPAFGDLSLCELRQKHVMDWEDEHSDLASKTKRNILSPLRIALD